MTRDLGGCEYLAKPARKLGSHSIKLLHRLVSVPKREQAPSPHLDGVVLREQVGMHILQRRLRQRDRAIVAVLCAIEMDRPLGSDTWAVSSV